MLLSSWQVVFDSRASHDLKKLDHQHHPILPHVVQAIEALPANPHAGKPLTGSKRGSRSLRVGDFRIIYDLYPATQTIHVIRVGDRKEIYR